MAKTPKTVFDFLNDLREQLTPGGAREVAHLLEIKKEDLKSRGLGMYIFPLSYTFREN